MGISKIQEPFLGGPYSKDHGIIVYWDPFWGSLFMETLIGRELVERSERVGHQLSTTRAAA